MVLNKIDTVSSNEDDLFDECCESVEELQAQIQASVKDASGIKFPLSSVLAISGKWALTSCMLKNSDEHSQDSW